MERPNIQAIRNKLQIIKDATAKKLVTELLGYVELLERTPHPISTRPKTRGKTAKDYRAQIDKNDLPFDPKEKTEDRLPNLVEKLLSYAEYLEKR